jgi:hypothetical protein
LEDKRLSLSDNQTTYRFTWLRSFNEPYVVRIDRTESGAEITVRTLLNRRVEVARHAISEAEWKDFLAFIYRIGFWTAVDPSLQKFQNEDLECQTRRNKRPLCEITVTADGAEWSVEAVHDGHYHSLTDNSPQSGALYEIGVHMLEVAHVHFHGKLY